MTMSWWNSLGDTAKRLFVPFGGDVDNENAPVWDLGGQMQRSQDHTDQAERQRKNLLYGQAAASGAFADQAQGGYSQLGGEAAAQRDYLRRLGSGQDSVSAEQLRQALQQNVAAQRSMAAGASPQNAAMAARTAAIQSGRLGAGLAGQQAVAGLQERQSAQQALSNMIMQQRQQELQASLQGRQGAIQGYGANNAGEKEKGGLEKYGPAAIGALGAIFSDRLLKTDIRAAEPDANKAIEALKPYAYKYKDQQHGAGPQLGVMAQDLERAGLGHTVIDTPAGKAVDTGKLSGANTALIAALGQRVAALEGGGGGGDAGRDTKAEVEQNKLHRRRADLAVGYAPDAGERARRGAEDVAVSDPAAAAAMRQLNARREMLRRMAEQRANRAMLGPLAASYDGQPGSR